MKPILLTAFGAFNNEAINPSEVLLSQISHPRITKKVVLAVAYEESFNRLKREFDKDEFAAVLMLGQAGGRSFVGMERFAMNMADSEIPDAQGVLFQERKISPDGPVAYQTSFPLREWMKTAQGLPLEISNSAGTYVCNYLSYRVAEKLGTQSLFVHLPYLPEQVSNKPPGMPYLELGKMKQCLEFIISQCATATELVKR